MNPEVQMSMFHLIDNDGFQTQFIIIFYVERIGRCSNNTYISTFKVLCGRASTTIDLASKSAPC